MKQMVYLFFCAICAGAVADGDYSDADIRRILTRSVRFCHADDMRDEREYALVCCGYDTNRLTRIMQDIVRSGDGVSPEALRWIGEYGTTNNLPFLYGCLTNAVLGENAVYSVLKIEGATSNSIARIGEYLSLTNAPLVRRREAGFDLINAVVRRPPSDVTRRMVVAKAWGYVKDENVYSDMLDAAIIRADPSYRFSRRRLAALRSAYALGLNQYAVTYVTNAINELVAYPEANLPE